MGAKSVPLVWQMSRSGELVMDPGTLASRAKAFTAAIPRRRSVSLLVVRDETAMRSYLLAPDLDGSHDAAEHVAAAVAARAVPVADGVDGLDLSCIASGSLVFRKGGSRRRDTQVGADMAALAQTLGRVMRPGSWVAAQLRVPDRREDRWFDRWLTHRLETALAQHPSLQTGAVVMSLRAGGDSRDEVERLLGQVAAAMPGFDMPTKVVVPGRWGPLSFAGVMAAMWSVMAVLLSLSPVWWVGLSAALLIVGVMLSLQRRGGMAHESAVSSVVASPPRLSTPPRRPQAPKPGDDGRRARDGSDGDYPLARSAFMVGPHQPVGLIAPHGGGVAGATGTAERAVPPVVAERIGPMLGRGRGNTPVHLSAADSFAGVVALGRAGSGKSVALHQLFAWHLLERAQPSGLPGAPGQTSACVVIESKRDGAVEYMDWANTFGGHALLVDVMDAGTPAIDLTPRAGSLVETARQLVSQMRYAFGEDAIGHRSFQTLTELAMGALVVDEAVAAEAGVEPGRPTLYYMGVLVEAFGTDMQKALGSAIVSESVRRKADGQVDPDLMEAASLLRGFFSRTDAQRRQFTDAPGSKIKPLLALESWWDPSRPRIAWRDVLDRHGVVVINVSSPVADPSRMPMDESLSQQLQAMLAYSLKVAIQSTCAGWQAQGRSVAIFCDELSLFAGTSPEVVTWLRDQGRSYGVRPFFAAQYPEQLDPRVRTSVLGFSTLLAMTQDNPQVAGALSEDFGADGSAWSASDVVNLPRFHAIARMNVGQQRQSAFTFALTSWEGSKVEYAQAQGYVWPPVGGV